MQLPGKILDRGNDARSRPIDGIADDSESTIEDGIEQDPSRLCRKSFKIVNARIGVRRSKNEVVWLKANYFFQVHLRPIVIGVND